MSKPRPLIAVSQRVDNSNSYRERRDVLDQRWASFLDLCGCSLAPMPNVGDHITAWLNQVAPQGIVLTGGNDLIALGGDAPERDNTEAAATKWAVESKTPLVGVCRGMQFLLHSTGSKLERLPGHSATRHRVTGAFDREVNSFHDWCVTEVSAEWFVLARCRDETIEAVRHTFFPQAAIMWHPEREVLADRNDVQWMSNQFGVSI